MDNFCPYIDGTKTTVKQYVYDQLGRLIQETTIEKHNHAVCQQDNCEAYVDGECSFTQGGDYE